MIYLELRDLLNSMSAKELMQPVVAYSGNIDDTIKVIGTSVNSNEDMGETLDTYPNNQVFLVLE
jgi:hypothetical protein